ERAGARGSGDVDVRPVDRPDDLERVVTGGRGHERGDVPAWNTVALREIEGRFEPDPWRGLAGRRDDRLEIVRGQVGDRLALGVGDRHLDGVGLVDIGRLDMPADLEMEGTGVLHDVGGHDERLARCEGDPGNDRGDTPNRGSRANGCHEQSSEERIEARSSTATAAAETEA